MTEELTRQQQDQLEKKLQQLWQDDFPLSNAMQIQVNNFSEHSLTTLMPLQSNTNTHGTAFAGSLYAAQALTAWGMLYLELASQQLDASIIHASGQIEFARPLEQDIAMVCTLPDAPAHMQTLRSSGKLRLSLSTTATGINQPDEIASRFSGDYLVRLNR